MKTFFHTSNDHIHKRPSRRHQKILSADNKVAGVTMIQTQHIFLL